MAISGTRVCQLQSYDCIPLNATYVGLHAAVTLVVTYAKTAATTSFLGSALASNNQLKVTVTGTVALGDILQDAVSDELVLVTSISSAPTYAVTRGYRGTVRETHLTGATWNLVGQTVAISLLRTEMARCPQPVEIKGGMAGQTTLTGDVTVWGTNINGLPISDTIALNSAATVPGVKAFKTVATMDVPCAVTAADTVSLGVTKAVGLPWKVTDSRLIIKEFDGSVDAGSVTYDAGDVAKCIYTAAGTPTGTKKLALFIIV
jgi:hypothetical protein